MASATGYGSAGYRGYVLAMLTLIYALNFIDRNLINVIAQPIIQEFQLSDTQFGFLNGPPFAIFYALMGIPLAMAADRYHRVTIVALCIAVWSLMTVLCGFATSFAFLLMARVGVAIGEAGSTPPSNSILADYYPPKNRVVALGVFAMGVTLGSALANFFGGPLARGLDGLALQRRFEQWGWEGMATLTDWSQVAGWRVAFVVIGVPGLVVGLITLLTVKEPPRGYSDPPAAPSRAGLMDTLRALAHKPAFWNMALGASIVSVAGYGLIGFQAPMAQRLHGIDAGAFALQFGGPLALVAALGTFAGGAIAHRLTTRVPVAVALVPAVGALLAVPLYLYAFTRPTEQLFGAMRVAWGFATFFHYMYLGCQYTIAQGVVGQRSRASAVAVLLLMMALIGNGIGPLFVGGLSDLFMSTNLAGSALTSELCRNAAEVAQLAASQQLVCRDAYGHGLQQSMMAATLLFIPAALFFYLSSRTLQRDMVAKLG